MSITLRAEEKYYVSGFFFYFSNSNKGKFKFKMIIHVS